MPIRTTVQYEGLRNKLQAQMENSTQNFLNATSQIYDPERTRAAYDNVSGGNMGEGRVNRFFFNDETGNIPDAGGQITRQVTGREQKIIDMADQLNLDTRVASNRQTSRDIKKIVELDKKLDTAWELLQKNTPQSKAAAQQIMNEAAKDLP